MLIDDERLPLLLDLFPCTIIRQQWWCISCCELRNEKMVAAVERLAIKVIGGLA
jgi:hypothetical protein